jgi:hypothetical protein
VTTSTRTVAMASTTTAARCRRTARRVAAGVRRASRPGPTATSLPFSRGRPLSAHRPRPVTSCSDPDARRPRSAHPGRAAPSSRQPQQVAHTRGARPYRAPSEQSVKSDPGNTPRCLSLIPVMMSSNANRVVTEIRSEVCYDTNPCHVTANQAASDGSGLAGVCSPDGI